MKKNISECESKFITNYEFSILLIENAPIWVNKPKDKYNIVELPTDFDDISLEGRSYNDFVSVERKYSIFTLDEFIDNGGLVGLFENRFIKALENNKYIDFFRENYQLTVCLICHKEGIRDSIFKQLYVRLYETHHDMLDFKLVSKIENLKQYGYLIENKDEKDFKFFVNLFHNKTLECLN